MTAKQLEAAASMGPHFFKCGKKWTKRRRLLAAISFNGAALFQVRKGSQSWEGAEGEDGASMGPHFFKCGKQCSFCWRFIGGYASMGPHFFKCGKPAFLRGLPLMDAALQWGRTFSSAERNNKHFLSLRK